MALLLTLVAELIPAQGRGFYLTVWSCGRPACQPWLSATKYVLLVSLCRCTYTYIDICTYTDAYARL